MRAKYLVRLLWCLFLNLKWHNSYNQFFSDVDHFVNSLSVVAVIGVGEVLSYCYLTGGP